MQESVRLIRLQTTRNNQFGGEFLHHLIPLITGQAAHSGRPPIGPRPRRRDLHHFAFDPQRVTWPCRLRPGEFAAGTNDSHRRAAARRPPAAAW